MYIMDFGYYGAHVELTKLGDKDSPEVPTPAWDKYKLGERNDGLSVPSGYSVKGHLIRGVNPGFSVLVERYERNGETIDGYMETSTVKEVEHKSPWKIVFTTRNSRYCLTFLDEERNETNPA
jgi:hypothetical protein